MEISREELLRQKQLLEEQLDWVNRKLDQAGEKAISSDPAAQPEAEDPGRAFAEAAQHFVQPAADSKTQQADQALEAYAERSTANNGQLSKAEKIGCAALGLGLAGGVLFALFILPYLIY